MEKLQKYYLSFLLVFLILGCQDRKKLSLESLEFSRYHYQGSAINMNALQKAIALDSTNANAWREASIPFLKRGMPHLWKAHYDKAVQYNPEVFQPARGYLYLWFYRDYKKAIVDFNSADVFTPGFTDAPFGHSVDYWRGIAYLGLNDLSQSIAYFDQYINSEIAESGEDWVELTAFLFRGIAYYEMANYSEALINFDKLLHYGGNQYADAKYYKALILKQQGAYKKAKKLSEEAIIDFKNGYYNYRPYVESMRQLYMEDYLALEEEIDQLWPKKIHLPKP